MNFAPPLFRFLPFAEAANIACSLFDGVLQFWRSLLPRFPQLSFRHAHGFVPIQTVPANCITSQSPILIVPHAIHDAPHPRLNCGEIFCTTLLQRAHEPVSLSPVKYPHHITTLFSGYSTIP